jgi:hypothetical protein
VTGKEVVHAFLLEIMLEEIRIGIPSHGSGFEGDGFVAISAEKNGLKNRLTLRQLEELSSFFVRHALALDQYVGLWIAALLPNLVGNAPDLEEGEALGLGCYECPGPLHPRKPTFGDQLSNCPLNGESGNPEPACQFVLRFGLLLGLQLTGSNLIHEVAFDFGMARQLADRGTLLGWVSHVLAYLRNLSFYSAQVTIVVKTSLSR